MTGDLKEPSICPIWIQKLMAFMLQDLYDFIKALEIRYALIKAYLADIWLGQNFIEMTKIDLM